MPKSYGRKRRGGGKSRNRKPYGRRLKRGRNAVKTSALNQRMPRGFLQNYNDFSPLPNSMYTKFVYTGQGELSSVASQTYTGSAVEWRLNSIYDPCTSVTGTFNNGCYGYGKLLSTTGPYTRYKVNGAMVEILIFDSKGTDSDSNEICFKANVPNDPTTIAGVQPYNAESIPMCKVIRLADSGSQRRQIKQYFPMSQMFGWTKEQFRVDKDNTTAPWNNNPGSTPTFSIALANARGATTATSVMLRVKITYFVECYSRVQDVF